MKTLSVGDEVAHKTFGRGTIRSVKGHENYAKLTIEFDKKITKVILAKYVKLIKK